MPRPPPAQLISRTRTLPASSCKSACRYDELHSSDAYANVVGSFKLKNASAVTIDRYTKLGEGRFTYFVRSSKAVSARSSMCKSCKWFAEP